MADARRRIDPLRRRVEDRPLLCALGLHRFGSWEPCVFYMEMWDHGVRLAESDFQSSGWLRTCDRCGIEQAKRGDEVPRG